MNKIMMDFLARYAGSTISLMVMERVVPGQTQYQAFAWAVQQLMAEGILVPIRSHGTNQAQPALLNGYRIKKQRLKADFFEEIRSRQLTVDSLLQMDCYFKGSEALWQKEKPWLDRLQAYLTTDGIPQIEASVWERSYEIMEKQRDVHFASQYGLTVKQRKSDEDLA